MRVGVRAVVVHLKEAHLSVGTVERRAAWTTLVPGSHGVGGRVVGRLVELWAEK